MDIIWKLRIWLVLGLLGIAALIAAWVFYLNPELYDVIQVTNWQTGQVHVLVDGMRGINAINDEHHTMAPGSPITINDFTASDTASMRGQIIAFAEQRPPTLKIADDGLDPPTFTWSYGTNFAYVGLPTQYPIDLYVWVTSGNFMVQEGKALEAITRTNEIWLSQHQGIRINVNGVHIMNRTGDPDQDLTTLNQMDGDPRHKFDCTDLGLFAAGGRKMDNAINVYYASRVSSPEHIGAEDQVGVHCDGFSILLGSVSRPDLLAHEIGHALNLEHIDKLTINDLPIDGSSADPFCSSGEGCRLQNLMHSASDTRQFLTEGQTLRAIVMKDNVLNHPSYYNLRPNKPVKDWIDCPTQLTSDKECPELQLRLWPDS